MNAGSGSMMKMMDPARIISHYAEVCGVEKLTQIFIQVRERIDPKMLIEIDEAWNLAKRDPKTGKYCCNLEKKDNG